MKEMTRNLLTAFCFAALGTMGMTQVNVGGTPFALLMGMDRSELPTYEAAPLDMKSVARMDEQRAQEGKLPFYGRLLPVGKGLSNAGQWMTLPNGDRVWRARFDSPGALANELFFTDFHLPENALLYVYDDTGDQVLGGFTSYNNSVGNTFTTAQIMGSSCIVEYYEPHAVQGLGTFEVSHIGHAYRFVGAAKAQDCEVDVACSPEGDNWQDEARGVVRISVVDQGNVGWCTGSVVNNRAPDCRPFVLTAFHCGETSTTANFNNWKFYFQYQRPGCESGQASVGKVMTGCIRRADSNDGGGSSGSDFLLVEIVDPIPTNYDPYWNGWNATGTGSNNGVCIHHPAGDEKKVSTYTTNLTSTSWGSASGSHWRVIWSGTPNGHGVTEGGSSGSPIFNANKEIIGTLTGGGSFCNSVVPGGQNQPDYFGKVSYHWTNNPNPSNEKLKVWLDPGNTGLQTMPGSATPCTNVGITENVAVNDLAIYPNPATATVTIEYPAGITRVDRIELIDVSGRVVKVERSLAGERATMDVRDLGAGTYTVRLVHHGDRMILSRLVIATRP